MADDNANARAHQETPVPNPALKRLDVLVGTWHLKGRESGPDGEIYGQVTFRVAGRRLLPGSARRYRPHRAKDQGNRNHRVWSRLDGTSSQDRTSHYFDNTGNAFPYTWDVGDDTLTIWGGQRGSPAHFKGTFSDDRNTVTGRWEWPGGGYEATMTRAT